MKKLGYVILGAILGVLGSYFYCTQGCEKEMASTQIVKPKGVITPNEARTLDQAFNSRHQLISDSIVGRPDNRSSWYSLGDMRDYLNYAENQARESGYTMDGVRIYLGAHKGDGEEAGYTTMFLIPTGYQNIDKGSFLNMSTTQKSGDLTNGDGLDLGDPGNPPSANYPQ